MKKYESNERKLSSVSSLVLVFFSCLLIETYDMIHRHVASLVAYMSKLVARVSAFASLWQPLLTFVGGNSSVAVDELHGIDRRIYRT